jgi:hypothetical protein
VVNSIRWQKTSNCLKTKVKTETLISLLASKAGALFLGQKGFASPNGHPCFHQVQGHAVVVGATRRTVSTGADRGEATMSHFATNRS